MKCLNNKYIIFIFYYFEKFFRKNIFPLSSIVFFVPLGTTKHHRSSKQNHFVNYNEL